MVVGTVAKDRCDCELLDMSWQHTPSRSLMVDMEVIMRLQDHGHCASVTCMIRHYVANGRR